VIADAGTLFARHLDLRPLRGRRRGVTRCPFHEDRHPSLSVDLDKAIFHCFSCRRSGGPRQFAALVGEASTVDYASAARQLDREPALAWWRALVQRARRDDDRRIAWLPWWRANDAVRLALNAVREARRAAGQLGPDHPRTWRLLELAADAERRALLQGAQLDTLLEEGPLTLDGDDRVEPVLERLAGRA
jgi:hypothetical protein